VRHAQADAAARHRAERVVEEAVSAAVEQVSSVASASGRSEEVGEARETRVSEESVRVEEESSVRTSSTRLVLDAGAESVREQVERAQREFYRQGKEAAEQAVGRLVVEASEEQGGSGGGSHAAVVA